MNHRLQTSVEDIFAAGDAAEFEYTVLRQVDMKTGKYRKLVLRDKRILGAILLNDSRSRPIKRLIEQKTDVSNHTDQLLDDGFDLNALQWQQTLPKGILKSLTKKKLTGKMRGLEGKNRQQCP